MININQSFNYTLKITMCYINALQIHVIEKKQKTKNALLFTHHRHYLITMHNKLVTVAQEYKPFDS